MKNLLFITLTAVCLMGFTANANARAIDEKNAQKASENKDFSINLGRHWILTSVSINGKDTGFARDELKGMPGEEEIFSLTFDGKGFLSGVGAPNRYSGPYTTSEKQTITIPPMRSTLMAALFEPNNLKEYEFYVYLQGAYRWDRKEQKLMLYSKTGDDEVVLTFDSKD